MTLRKHAQHRRPSHTLLLVMGSHAGVPSKQAKKATRKETMKENVEEAKEAANWENKGGAVEASMKEDGGLPRMSLRMLA